MIYENFIRSNQKHSTLNRPSTALYYSLAIVATTIASLQAQLTAIRKKPSCFSVKAAATKHVAIGAAH